MIEKWNERENITAGTSLRSGGFSSGGFASLNLALHVGDKEEDVKKNRAYFFSNPLINMTEANTVFVAQHHSDITKKVTFADAGKGFNSFADGIKADALYTKEKGLNLAIYHADCVPLFVDVPTHQIVGIIHAGKDGSLNNITGKFIDVLVNEEGVKPEEIFVHLGPSLNFLNREISANEAFIIAKRGRKYQKSIKGVVPQYYLDLPALNIFSLLESGIPLENISWNEECVFENSDKYFSYTKDNVTGRNISFIRRNY